MTTIDERIKESKQKLGEKIPCSIEVLAPVHIGSGVKLAEGIDFVKSDSSVHIVSQSELMKYLENNQDEMNRFIQGNYKLSSLNRTPDGKRYNISLGRTSEINEFERNGNGKPYIPGSSIKGAIRTILIKKRFDELSPNEKNDLLGSVTSNRKEWASEPIVKQLLGDNSNNNLMRVLEVFDAEFEDLELERIFVLTLSSIDGSSFGWKKMGRDKKTHLPYPPQIDHNNATPIFAETLPMQSKGYFSISLNSFLLNDSTAANTLQFQERSLTEIKNLVSTINLYSKVKLENEIKFFSKLKSPKQLTSLLNEINNLCNDLNKLLDSQNSSTDEFILRISWGSGWKGMTGDYLDETWLNNFRRKYQLGKRDFPIFPKTRRIVFEGEEPKYLTGWIKVKINDVKKLNDGSKNTDSKIDEVDPIELLKQKHKVTDLKKKK